MEGKEKNLVSITEHPTLSPKKILRFEIKDGDQVEEYQCTMMEPYLEMREKYDNFNVRESDIFVVSIPRSGSTWTQELVWCVLNGLNHEDINKILEERFYFLERDMDVGLPVNDDENHPLNQQKELARLEEAKDGRLIKSHFPRELLPLGLWRKKAKVIYVCRDPRDMCVSMYYRRLRRNVSSVTLSGLAGMILTDLGINGSYWDHVLGFWKLRNEENVLFIRYEELKEDLPSMIRKVADFLGKKLTEDEVLLMADHLSFESMQRNTAINKEKETSEETEANETSVEKIGRFLRKGQVGDWKNHFDADLVNKFKEWTEKNLKDSDFPYYI